MSEILSDTSYYRLCFPKNMFYHPKIKLDRDPKKAESFTETFYTPPVPKLKLDANPNEIIRHSDIETMWKTGK